ncbi:uncharacterized protein BT62DRAFT_899420 [Guyanagaster necrorhizus]|uniref:Uncharacterized protein n=1 Tax=Guyanagaster necrorhizus TaxID=856835 RepID=A0A9P8AR47_9AGAR|nr:uncharacterized protein BT62DRAFT_899420 [Guyanagaster necrorhizus MCA 3950]KAG7444680.1 hypothetical protein BT62DRAFT_899420 [Guyanagaster necrorhizus MCA 3950]
MKMHGYISEWGIDSSKRGKMVYRTVKQMIAYFYASFRNTSRTHVAKSLDAKITVNKAEVDWLGCNAFYTVLLRKPRGYAWVLKELRGDIGRLKGSRCRKRFRGLFAEGLGSVEQIAY